VRVIERFAFSGCAGLTRLEIPPGAMTIGRFAFQGCSGLARLQIPSDLGELGSGVFKGVTRIEHLTLVGSVLSPAVVTAVRGCLVSTARVVGSALEGREFGSFAIVAI
jgi:hypothetical protein